MNAEKNKTCVVPILERLALTREQAAELLSVPADTVENQTREGGLRSVQIGKHKRWLLEDLREYLQRLRDNGNTNSA